MNAINDALALLVKHNYINIKMDNNANAYNSTETFHTPFTQTYFRGTKANLITGELIEIGFNLNLGKQTEVK